MDKPYSIGFMGTSSNEVLEVASEFVIGDVFMPFTGSGKDISVLSQEGRTITSFDTQYLSQLSVDGVFNQPANPTSSIVEGFIPEETGYACANPPFKRMDELTLRMIDGIAIHGTLYDKAALTRALIQGTIGGRLTHWDTTPEKFATKVRNGLINNLDYVNLPGTRVHHKGSVFDLKDQWPRAHTMWIDPPKVVTSTDVYSKQFVGLNSVLAQETQLLPVWKWTDMIPRHKQLWEHPVKRIIQFYCSDVRPTDDAVRAALEPFGKLVERIRVRHGSRADYIYIYDKEA